MQKKILNQEVDTRFKQRVGDIDFWKSELESKLAEMKESLDAADSQRIRLEKALVGFTIAIKMKR